MTLINWLLKSKYMLSHMCGVTAFERVRLLELPFIRLAFYGEDFEVCPASYME